MAATLDMAPATDVRWATDPSSIAQATALEKLTWLERNYPGLEDYDAFKAQSRIIGVFSARQCLGMTRMFDGHPRLPPFFVNMPIERADLRAYLMKGCLDGTVEELGTTAVAHSARQINAALQMWRLAYRSAASRRIKTWGIIMEPERVRVMKKRYGFPFQQIGPSINYQGGMCAAHMMQLDDVHTAMLASRPAYYRWFVEEPLHGDDTMSEEAMFMHATRARGAPAFRTRTTGTSMTSSRA